MELKKYVKIYNDHPMTVKYNNKAVSNFEAGKLQENIDTHLSKYCYCQNDHFREVFIHPDIQGESLRWLEIGFIGLEPP